MPHKLTNILPQVPRDIEIAQASIPIPIDQIAREVGILPEELDLYGRNKAKVRLSIRDSPPECAERSLRSGHRHHAHPPRRR